MVDMDQRFVDRMSDGCRDLGISLQPGQMEQFYQYYEILIEWNKVMNLTAITELEDVVYKHFIDSLSLIRAVDGWEDSRVCLIDVGTGAGFPGIPLKIAFPFLSVTLLDSLNKRVSFLQEVIARLSLSDIAALHGRAEDFGRDSRYREKFDICVSRAVANISTLSEYCVPFIKIGGLFVAYKSDRIEEELETGKSAIRVLGGEICKNASFVLSGTDAKRNLLVIKKVKATGKAYPRRAGLPGKEPII